MKKAFLALALSISVLLPAQKVQANPEQPKIQIAILLDSSNSMDGLIDQAKNQLWHIVNTLTDVRKNGKIPQLEVALYEYGNDSLPASEGYVRQLTGFTSDLDKISEKLFEIRTNGGEEYVGWVIQSAMRQLGWNEDKENFRVIFVAGNEPFNQGNIDYSRSIRIANQEDTIVNTIYCGQAENEERRLWADGAYLGKGSNFNINQNQVIPFIESPYDSELQDLNNRLNQTYIPYGSEGVEGQTRQLEQDANSGLNIATRGASKVTEYYQNSTWDLVDALDTNTVSLDDLSASALPPEMQGMTLEQREDYINQKKAEREQIQERIRQLSQQRETYVQQKLKDLHQNDGDTLDSAIIQALRQQLKAKGFDLQE